MTKKQKIALKLLEDDRKIQQLSKPIQKITDIEIIAKEQNFQPIDKVAFFKQMDEWGIEALLSMI